MKNTYSPKQDSAIAGYSPIEKNGSDHPQSITHFNYFPVHWLVERINHVLESESPELISFPKIDSESPLGKLIEEYHFSEEECILLYLAFSATFSPELLTPFSEAINNKSLAPHIGGFFMKGFPMFCPTVRTAVFLLAGRDLEKRARYASCFHARNSVFTSGIVQSEPKHPSSVFLDHQLIFSDSFLGTVLLDASPRLDGDRDFPVRKSKASHLLSDVVLKEETRVEIEKLGKFARNMKSLWEIDVHHKVRSNFISIFSGDPGTGKSHAAEAVGNEFGLPVYKVNFAQMISKYIGETEKNLEKVFDRFDKQPCILFFDEAESIFSKRTEVTDSHDQHANNLQSYLLQKVEEFNGIIVLATNVQNLSQYFDKAFQRRFRSMVNFEFPDYPERRKIWEKALFGSYLFEEGLVERLAKNYQLSGGSIYNVVSDGIIEALEKDTELITFELLEIALADEFKKTSRKFEVCTDEMVMVNPSRRYGVGYEQRKNF